MALDGDAHRMHQPASQRMAAARIGDREVPLLGGLKRLVDGAPVELGEVEFGVGEGSGHAARLQE